MNKYLIKLDGRDDLITALADEAEEVDGVLTLYLVNRSISHISPEAQLQSAALNHHGSYITPIDLIIKNEKFQHGLFRNVEYFYVGEDKDNEKP